MKASEVGADARDELATNYTKNAYVNEHGNVCSVAAIERVAMKNMAFKQAGVFQSALQDKFEEVYESRSIENTHDRISKAAVLDVFDKTIIGLEEVGL